MSWTRLRDLVVANLPETNPVSGQVLSNRFSVPLPADAADLQVTAEAIDVNGDRVAPTGTVDLDVVERLPGVAEGDITKPDILVDTAITVVVNLGTPVALTLPGPGDYQLVATASAGLPGAATRVRLYTKPR